MTTLLDMKLGTEKQISYRSTPEIVAKLDLAASKLSVREVTVGGSKLRTGHLVNAVALWIGELSEDELYQFAAPKIAVLAERLGRGDGDSAAETPPNSPTAGAEESPPARRWTHVPIYGDPPPEEAEVGGGRRRRRGPRKEKD